MLKVLVTNVTESAARTQLIPSEDLAFSFYTCSYTY